MIKVLFRFLTSAFVLILVIVQYQIVPSSQPDAPGNPAKFDEFLKAKIESKSKPRPDRPKTAMKYLVDMRSEVGKSFSYSGSWKFDAYKAAKDQSSLRKDAITYDWTERGPANIGGRTRSIAVHPQNDNEWWVAAVGGGVWHTTNAGASWENQTDELPSIATTTLAICQSDPSVLYVGTGEGFYNYDALWGDGVFMTSDGGENWIQIPTTANNSDFRYVNRLIVDPERPDTVIAATNTGVFRSLNGGDSWTKTHSGRVQQVIANPENFQTQYMTINSNGVYKSLNGGQSWVKVSAFTANGRIEIALAPSDTSILYAVTEPAPSYPGLYRSQNSGASWTQLIENNNPTNWLGGQGWYDNTIAVSPNDPNEVVVGGIDLYRLNIHMANENFSLLKLTHWYVQNAYPYVHADQHFLVLIPSGQTAYKIIAANDGGIHYSTNSGTSWIDKNNGFNVTQYYDGDRSPLSSQYIGGTQDNGTHVSPEDADISSAWEEQIGGDGFDCVWDKYNPGVLYGTLYDTRIFKSVNGGNTFEEKTNGIGSSDIFHTPLALNPYDSDNLVTATNYNMLYVTYDGAENWQGRNLGFNSGYIKLAYAQSNGNIIWAGSSSTTLFVSTDKGVSFTPVNSANTPTNLFITGINTSAVDDSTAYLTYGVSGYAKILKTTDLGQSWADITGDLPNIPVNTLLEMSYDPQELWIGTDIGLFISKNGGTNWTFADDNLPSVGIFRLKNHGKEVLAVTHGRGFFTTVNEQLPDFEIIDAPPRIQSLSYTDPVTREVSIRFYNLMVHDSMHLFINDSLYQVYGNTPSYTITDYMFVPDVSDLWVRSYVVGFTEGARYASKTDSLILLNAPATDFTIDFNSGEMVVTEDFNISTTPGFSNPLLHTNHPYAEKTELTAMLRTPVLVQEASGIYYKDVAIVEPGETGSAYPNPAMYDYVTVEGSLDGESWTVLITPYDCRSNSTWNTTYNAGGNGSESMFVDQKIDLNNYYDIGDAVIIRFRLFSDDLVAGWGWAIDDVIVTSTYTDITDPDLYQPQSFKLLGNYPNPFNPGTTIKFSTDPGKLVSLDIYNSLGQKVRTLFNNKIFKLGQFQEVYWDGKNDSGQSLSSGLYLYRLKSQNDVSSRKMLLIK